MWRSVRIREDRYDEVAALARDEGRSVASMVDRLLVRGVAVPGGRDPDSSLASGVGAKASTGSPVVSTLVASDGALAEPVVASSTNPETRRGIGAGTGLASKEAARPGRDDQATSGERPGSASAPEPPPLSLPVFGAGGDLPPKPAKTPAELAASFPGVTTGGELDLAKKQVTPHLKQEQAKGGKR